VAGLHGQLDRADVEPPLDAEHGQGADAGREARGDHRDHGGDPPDPRQGHRPES
jgi:hypothetical protein